MRFTTLLGGTLALCALVMLFSPHALARTCGAEPPPGDEGTFSRFVPINSIGAQIGERNRVLAILNQTIPDLERIWALEDLIFRGRTTQPSFELNQPLRSNAPSTFPLLDLSLPLIDGDWPQYSGWVDANASYLFASAEGEYIAIYDNSRYLMPVSNGDALALAMEDMPGFNSNLNLMGLRLVPANLPNANLIGYTNNRVFFPNPNYQGPLGRAAIEAALSFEAETSIGSVDPLLNVTFPPGYT